MSSEEVLEDLKSTAGSEAGAADAIVALDAACKLSLSVEGRARLVEDGAAEIASRHLSTAAAAACSSPSSPQLDAESPAQQRLSLALRLCRNLCAGQPTAREAFRTLGLPAAVQALVSTLARQEPTPLPVLAMAFQMLCNLCVEDSAACEMVWCGHADLHLRKLAFHTDTFNQVATLRGDGAGAALAPLCMLLRASCQRSDSCRRSLATADSARLVLAPLLEWAAGESHGEELGDRHCGGEASRWLALLVADLCARPGALRECLATLANLAAPASFQKGAHSGGRAVESFSVHQGILLHFLAETLEERSLSGCPAGREDGGLIDADDVACVCAMLQRAAAALPEPGTVPPSSKERHNAVGPESKEDVGSADACVDAGADAATGTIIAAGLRVLQSAALVAEETSKAGEALAQAIISSGVIETLVSALEKLGDPAGPRGGRPAPSGPGPFVEEDANDGPVSKKQTAPTATTAGAADGTGTAASVASDGAPLPPAELFFGFRRDIVAVLGNVCHDRPAAVDALMAAGGVPLMLQQCRGEEGESYLREWAIWAVRNICEASEAARSLIQELQPVGVAKGGDDLDRMGLEVEWDAEKSRPVIRPKKPL